MRRIVLSIVVLSTLACGGNSSDSPITTPPVVTPVATSSVNVNDNTFSPEAAEISINAPLTWTWQGAAQHNVTFEDGKESSGTKAAGTHSRTFATAGTYRYRCTIHSSGFSSGMVGSVVVQ
ncbi:MAG: plastocyanin/azurin family copper-binding protein [Gemmatimonadaceae bacterium]